MRLRLRLVGVFALLFLLALSPSLASNMTVEELIASYDFDFYNGTLNITAFDDYMIDSDNNSVNDTLIINLTTDADSSAAYFFIVSFVQGDDLVQNYTNATVNSSNQEVQVTFNTADLTEDKYNYSVEIREQDYSLEATI